MSEFENFTPLTPDSVATPVYERRSDGLAIRLETADSVGFWRGIIPVKGGATCRIELEVAASDALDKVNVGAIVTFQKGETLDTGIERDYLIFEQERDGVRIYGEELPVPAAATTAEVRFFLRWQPGEAVLRKLTITETAAIAPRPARIVTTKINPVEYPSTVEKNLKMIESMLNRIELDQVKPDLILFTECLTDRGVPGSMTARCETVPGGPTFALLSAYARKLNSYIVISLHERDGERNFNSAIIVGREGELVGKYRKVHLAMVEMENGLIPGSEYPVFDLDFGKVGIMICWDHWFGESARLLRLNGAELLLLPIAGDGAKLHQTHVWPTRAIDNGIPLVTSPTNPDTPARIISGLGEVLAESEEDNTYIYTDIDFSRRTRQFWLSVGPADGEARTIFVGERRPTTYGGLL
ncbi:MAG: carbon-nitrogen hydrolase family protein [Victivallaceae bacterium]